MLSDNPVNTSKIEARQHLIYAKHYPATDTGEDLAAVRRISHGGPRVGPRTRYRFGRFPARIISVMLRGNQLEESEGITSAGT